MEKNRALTLDKIDFIKVLMMILVIIGHSIALWLRSGWFNQPPAIPSETLTICIGWLNFTHIYVFVFCSGYLFYYLELGTCHRE